MVTVYQGVIFELTLEVAKNTRHLNDEIDFAGSEGLVSMKTDPPVGLEVPVSLHPL